MAEAAGALSEAAGMYGSDVKEVITTFGGEPGENLIKVVGDTYERTGEIITGVPSKPKLQKLEDAYTVDPDTGLLLPKWSWEAHRDLDPVEEAKSINASLLDLKDTSVEGLIKAKRVTGAGVERIRKYVSDDIKNAYGEFKEAKKIFDENIQNVPQTVTRELGTDKPRMISKPDYKKQRENIFKALDEKGIDNYAITIAARAAADITSLEIVQQAGVRAQDDIQITGVALQDLWNKRTEIKLPNVKTAAYTFRDLMTGKKQTPVSPFMNMIWRKIVMQAAIMKQNADKEFGYIQRDIAMQYANDNIWKNMEVHTDKNGKRYVKYVEEKQEPGTPVGEKVQNIVSTAIVNYREGAEKSKVNTVSQAQNRLRDNKAKIGAIEAEYKELVETADESERIAKQNIDELNEIKQKALYHQESAKLSETKTQEAVNKLPNAQEPTQAQPDATDLAAVADPRANVTIAPPKEEVATNEALALQQKSDALAATAEKATKDLENKTAETKKSLDKAIADKKAKENKKAQLAKMNKAIDADTKTVESADPEILAKAEAQESREMAVAKPRANPFRGILDFASDVTRSILSLPAPDALQLTGDQQIEYARLNLEDKANVMTIFADLFAHREKAMDQTIREIAIGEYGVMKDFSESLANISDLPNKASQWSRKFAKKHPAAGLLLAENIRKLTQTLSALTEFTDKVLEDPSLEAIRAVNVVINDMKDAYGVVDKILKTDEKTVGFRDDIGKSPMDNMFQNIRDNYSKESAKAAQAFDKYADQIQQTYDEMMGKISEEQNEYLRKGQEARSYEVGLPTDDDPGGQLLESLEIAADEVRGGVQLAAAALADLDKTAIDMKANMIQKTRKNERGPLPIDKIKPDPSRFRIGEKTQEYRPDVSELNVFIHPNTGKINAIDKESDVLLANANQNGFGSVNVKIIPAKNIQGAKLKMKISKMKDPVELLSVIESTNYRKASTMLENLQYDNPDANAFIYDVFWLHKNSNKKIKTAFKEGRLSVDQANAFAKLANKYKHGPLYEPLLKEAIEEQYFPAEIDAMTYTGKEIPIKELELGRQVAGYLDGTQLRLYGTMRGQKEIIDLIRVASANLRTPNMPFHAQQPNYIQPEDLEDLAGEIKGFLGDVSDGKTLDPISYKSYMSMKNISKETKKFIDSLNIEQVINKTTDTTIDFC